MGHNNNAYTLIALSLSLEFILFLECNGTCHVHKRPKPETNKQTHRSVNLHRTRIKLGAARFACDIMVLVIMLYTSYGLVFTAAACLMSIFLGTTAVGGTASIMQKASRN